ncbi:structural maintenance of chromosomes protein 3 [Diutina catenulata]
MIIKKITIQGFKTYKNTTVIDDLSPHLNIVLGRNGSGKSNFFAAVRFVLSDAYTNMSREERQGLIHEGSGTVMSAFVEIVFDNSDKRFPLARGEVAIRRTIGLKKDDYSVDGKSVTRADVMNMLESAGFARSNPYYIVPQGRITSLTNSRDADRLQLLKEVSGAVVFERKLRESMKEMDANSYKTERIDEALSSLAERLSDLQIESADLAEFQTLEKRRKVYEYNLLDRELNSLHTSIEGLDEEYQQVLSQSNRDLGDLQHREELCVELTAAIADLTTRRTVAARERGQLELDHSAAAAAVEASEAKLAEWRDAADAQEEGASSRIAGQIADTTAEIENRRQLLADHRPLLEQARLRERELKEQLMSLTSLQRGLYSKQNRFAKFKTKSARDKWLKGQISSIQSQIDEKTTAAETTGSELSALESQNEELRGDIMNLEAAIDDTSADSEAARLQKDITQAKKTIDEVADQRKQLWRDQIKYQSIGDALSAELTQASSAVHRTMTRQQAQGLDAIKQLATQLGLENEVHGSLAELFDVSDKYKVATEVIAGNTLFNVVVDTDTTAARLMAELQRTKSGRVTFIPLNQVPEPANISYPDATANRCFPLMKKLKYDSKFAGVISQVFARVLVCADLEVASELARAHQLVGITMDGDRADTKGVLSGGFRDRKKSRIDAIKTRTRRLADVKANSAKLEEVAKAIDTANAQLTSAHNQLKLTMRDLDRVHHDREPKKSELIQCQSRQYALQQQIADAKAQLASVSSSKATLTTTLQQHQHELNSDFAKTLSDDEQATLNRVSEEINEIEIRLDEVVSEVSQAEDRASELESEIMNNLEPRLSKLQARQADLVATVRSATDVEEAENEHKRLQTKLDAATARLEAITKEDAKLTKEIAKSEASLAKSNNQQLSIIAQVEAFNKSSEATLNKKAVMEQRRNEIESKIRELGVLPEEAFDKNKFDSLSANDLVKELKRVNEELTKYSHINKKALEQFSTFTTQSEDLRARRQELETGKDAITALIATLNEQKQQAITKSFEKVAAAFHDIFGKLVPRGVGHLTMVTETSENEGADSDVEMEDADPAQEQFVGVAIKVSFNSTSDEQQRIEQLSGGQKSLCAIALILAIQISDPAPFYLLDEVDANLDQQYRASVAAMIKTLSKKAQFICTTFRPEMIQVADRFYGVMYSNKVSTLEEVGQSEALNFVEV